MNDTNTTTVSIQLEDMSLDELVQLSQGLGHQIDKLREQRIYLKAKIDARLAVGERNRAAGDADAPGAVIDTATA